MAKQLINELQSLVSKLGAERLAHIKAVEEIDQTFRKLGISSDARKQGRSAVKKAVSRKGPRRQYKTTAAELVLGSVKKAGAKGATGAQLKNAWQAEKRLGSVYNTIGALVKERKIKRLKAKSGRGSCYTLA